MHNEDFSHNHNNRFGVDLTPAVDSTPNNAITALSMPKPLGITGWMAANASSRVVQGALVEATHEQCRMMLTSSALENVGTLSALEAHLVSVAPGGQERYRVIVDAYAVSTAMRVARW